MLHGGKQHTKELRSEHAAELRARELQMEKMRARLERALAEVEEWRRVGSEAEVHRRRAAEVRGGAWQLHYGARGGAMLQRRPKALKLAHLNFAAMQQVHARLEPCCLRLPHFSALKKLSVLCWRAYNS